MNFQDSSFHSFTFIKFVIILRIRGRFLNWKKWINLIHLMIWCHKFQKRRDSFLGIYIIIDIKAFILIEVINIETIVTFIQISSQISRRFPKRYCDLALSSSWARCFTINLCCLHFRILTRSSGSSCRSPSINYMAYWLTSGGKSTLQFHFSDILEPFTLHLSISER